MALGSSLSSLKANLFIECVKITVLRTSNMWKITLRFGKKVNITFSFRKIYWFSSKNQIHCKAGKKLGDSIFISSTNFKILYRRSCSRIYRKHRHIYRYFYAPVTISLKKLVLWGPSWAQVPNKFQLFNHNIEILTEYLHLERSRGTHIVWG